MAVSKSDYKNCNTSKPIATWSTGNDSVVLNATGHHYFLCGFPGHCGIGQKVDIRVAASGHSSAAPSMAPAPASGSEAPVAPGGGGGGRVRGGRQDRVDHHGQPQLHSLGRLQEVPSRRHRRYVRFVASLSLSLTRSPLLLLHSGVLSPQKH
jgi:hypothetical protein